jgi:ketosteroid isomerase-like protein
MPVATQEVRDVIATYIRAWVEQDPDLIVTIFTDTATYHERVLQEPIRNREGIRAYWQEKVVESQARITCKLLNLYLDGNTAIVEWEAQFDDVAQSVRKRMREVAILVFEGQLIASLREYWSSEPIGRIPQPLRSSVESSD